MKEEKKLLTEYTGLWKNQQWTKIYSIRTLIVRETKYSFRNRLWYHEFSKQANISLWRMYMKYDRLFPYARSYFACAYIRREPRRIMSASSGRKCNFSCFIQATCCRLLTTFVWKESLLARCYSRTVRDRARCRDEMPAYDRQIDPTLLRVKNS